MDLVGEILAKEPLVSRLVAAQALDVLEVEGGGLVFEKLVSLCGGSKYVLFAILCCPCCFCLVYDPCDRFLLLFLSLASSFFFLSHSSTSRRS